MTEEATPIEPATEAPAAAPTTAQPVEQTAVKNSERGRSWWIMSSAAGVALLVIGLLGGILIGQAMHPQGQNARTAQSFIDRTQPGQTGRLPEQMKERLQDRQPGQSNQKLPRPQRSVPPTGSNG